VGELGYDIRAFAEFQYSLLRVDEFFLFRYADNSKKVLDKSWKGDTNPMFLK
jgi:hypothetical protein